MTNLRDPQPTDLRPSSFLNAWSRVRVVAQHALDGPRSVTVSYDASSLNQWLEPLLKMRKRRQSPLFIETRCLLHPPNCLKKIDSSSLLLRVARWDGEGDKLACKQARCDFPCVLIAYYAINPIYKTLIDMLLRNTDQALKMLPFNIEGLSDASIDLSPPPSSENDVTISCDSLILGIWRRTRFQQLDFSWHEGDPSCTEFTRCFAEAFGRLQEMETAAQTVLKEQYVERYEIGSDPEALMKWLVDTKEEGKKGVGTRE